MHSMAGQAHLSPGRNPVRPGFPDVSGPEHPFLLTALNPHVITPRMTLWPAPTQTGGEVRAIAQTFMVGFGQEKKTEFALREESGTDQMGG